MHPSVSRGWVPSSVGQHFETLRALQKNNKFLDPNLAKKDLIFTASLKYKMNKVNTKLSNIAPMWE